MKPFRQHIPHIAFWLVVLVGVFFFALGLECQLWSHFHIAWLCLNLKLQTSWVALYSVVCVSVCEGSVTPDQISVFFVNICRHKSTLLTQYHLIPSSTELYWPSATKYQPGPPLTILTQYHHLPTSIAPYWPSTILYQPILPLTDPVPPSAK